MEQLITSQHTVSELQTHSAIMFTTEGFSAMHQCYKHKVTSEPVPEAEPVEPETPEEPTSESSSLFS